MMVQLGLTSYFKRQVIKWYSNTLHMKKPSGIIGKSEMLQVFMQTADPASTREATDRLVKILEITYAKADLYQVADNATPLNAEERTL